MKPIGMDVTGRDASASRAIPPALVSGRPDVDLDRVAAWRLGRLRDQLQRADAALAILTSPVSLRYAADFREYALFQSHIPMFYAFAAADGQVVMHGASRAAPGRFDEMRPARAVNFFDAGGNLNDEARALRPGRGGLPGRRRRIRAPRRGGVRQPEHHGRADAWPGRLEVIDAVDLMDRARSVKCDGEIECMRWALRVAEAGMRRMEAALVPGVTENRLWGSAARDQHRQRRGLDRRADALLWPQNQPLVPGGERQGDRSRRARRLRHRHDRAVRLLCGRLQDLALRGRRGPRPYSARSTGARGTKCSTTSRSSSRA